MPILTTLGAACARAWGFTSGLLKDPYFNLTTLLLPGNGTNGAQNNTFLDSSTNNFTITRNPTSGPNAPTQGTFSPFSQTGWGNYFSGGANYLTAPNNTALDLSTGDFTVECWFYPTSFSSTSALVFRYNGNYATGNDFQYGITVNTSGAVTVRPYQGATDFSINAGTAVLNSWNHIALVRTGNTFWGFLNGNRSASSQTITGALNNSTWATTVGATLSGTLGNTYANGYISNVRITKGGALYTTSTYTVPTAPLTTTVSAGTASLLTCQSNRFLDNSSNAFTITVNGSPTVVAFSPFAPTAAYTTAAVGGSGYFDGTGDYLEAGTASNWTFLSNTTALFSIEAWVYLSSAPATLHPICFTNAASSANIGFGFWINSSRGVGAEITIGSTGTRVLDATTTGTIQLGAWNYVAITYDQSLASGNCKIYINNAAAETFNKTGATPSSSSPSTALLIGRSNSSTHAIGYYGSLRISNVIRTITVPTAPYTSDANTSLLLNFTNAGITDATAKNDLETVGNAQIVSPTPSKFGGGSIAFDGTGDYLTAADNAAFDVGSGDWTIELWANFNSVSGEKGLVSHFTAGTPNAGYTLRLSTSNSPSGLRLVCSGSSDVVLQAAWTPVVSTWYHIAAVRNGGTLYIYVDGQQIGSTSIAITIGNPSALFAVGTAQTVASSDFNGYIDDLRFTKYARYTTGTGANAGKMVFNGTNTLALPTAPFPVQ